MRQQYGTTEQASDSGWRVSMFRTGIETKRSSRSRCQAECWAEVRPSTRRLLRRKCGPQRTAKLRNPLGKRAPAIWPSPSDTRSAGANCGAKCLLPWIRGTLIHSEFKRLVDSTCPQSMYHTEVSYEDRVVVRYGYPGSSRADVVVGPLSKPIAVYDLKTGGYISMGQAQAYGRNLPYATPFAAIYPKGL